jgi:outer membrane protein assembly factor BamB
MLDVLHPYITENCILHAEPGRVMRSKSGRDFKWLFDFRPLLLDARMASIVAELFWEEMAPVYKNQPFQLAAMEIAGIPMMSAILQGGMERGIATNGLIIRKKRKKNGSFQVIEGKNAGLPVVLVDDSLNSGQSIRQGALQLAQDGLKAATAFVIVDFKSTLGVKWAAEAGIEVKSLFSPADFGLTFKATHVPKTNYQVVWTFASPTPKLDFAVAKSSPVLHGGNILFGSDSGTFWCLERKTGRIVWWHRVQDKTGKGIISSPALDGDRVYFGAYDGTLHCRDARTGAAFWVRKNCEWIGSSPCVTADAVYVSLEWRGDPGGALCRIDKATGDIVWRYDVKKQLHGSPVVTPDGRMVVMGTNDCTMVALDAQTGTLLNKTDVGGPIKYHAALWGDCAVMCAFDAIYVWNFVTGDILFHLETDDINYSRPLIVGDRAFVGSADHNLYVIDLAAMRVEEIINVGEKIHSSPALVDNVVYFGTSAGELIGLDPLNLTILERLQFPERLTNTLISDGDLWFVYAFDNKLWAIRK